MKPEKTNQRSPVAAVICVLLLLLPASAHAHSFRGLGAVIVFVFGGAPAAIALLVLAIITNVFLVRKRYTNCTRKLGVATWVTPVAILVLYPIISLIVENNSAAVEVTLVATGVVLLFCIYPFIIGLLLAKRSKQHR